MCNREEVDPAAQLLHRNVTWSQTQVQVVSSSKQESKTFVYLPLKPSTECDSLHLHMCCCISDCVQISDTSVQIKYSLIPLFYAQFTLYVCVVGKKNNAGS